MHDVEIRRGYFPGSIGLVLELHARYYHAHWGFGVLFEAQLARGLAEFFGRYDELRDGFWIAAVSGRVEGSITIDGVHAADTGAHLRWFIMSDALRGKGVGTRLIHTAVDFCRAKKYRRVYLRTFAGLDAARHLYEKMGFRLVDQHPGTQADIAVTEQRFELSLE
jgi:GNAT superfamily N-acetyltransferase